MSESKSNLKPIVIYLTPEGERQFSEAIKNEAESKGWTVINKSEGYGNSEKLEKIDERYVIGYDAHLEENKASKIFILDEAGHWDNSLFKKKSDLNQTSLPSEYPSINNMFQETVLNSDTVHQYPLTPDECFSKEIPENE